jgi:hypothetical protein
MSASITDVSHALQFVHQNQSIGGMMRHDTSGIKDKKSANARGPPQDKLLKSRQRGSTVTMLGWKLLLYLDG